MSPQTWLWLVLGLLGVVLAHELTHLAIARAHGYRLLGIGLNPIGVAVVFEDSPDRRYWLLQLALPAATTWLLSLVWTLGLFGYLGPQIAVVPFAPQGAVVAGVTVLVLLTSGGDVAACVSELRRPLRGEARVARDLRLLRKLPTLVYFTEYGRRWKPLWDQLGVTETIEPTRAGA